MNEPKQFATNDAVDVGMAMARKVFAKRGNHSEIHLSEGELAGLLGAAYSARSEKGCSAPHAHAEHGNTPTTGNGSAATSGKPGTEARHALPSAELRGTPRTDAFCVSHELGDADPEQAFRTLLSFTGQLERELQAMNRLLNLPPNTQINVPTPPQTSAPSATAASDAEDAARWRIWSQQVVALADHNFPAHSTLGRLRDAMRESMNSSDSTVRNA